MSNKKPNFLIVGAPKAGTTAMWTFLRQHPDIFMADHKELLYFGRDLPIPQRYCNTLDEYLGCFQKAGDQKCRGEASTTYLFSKTAAREIKEFNPTMKIIVMLRRPDEFLHSFWSEQLWCGFEYVKNFSKALSLEESRKRGKNLPPSTVPVEALLYRQWAKYFKMMTRYHRSFEKNAIHVILYDDFKRNISGVYKKTLEFLGVDQNFQPDIGTVHTQKRIRSVLLQQYLRGIRSLPRWLQSIIPFGFSHGCRKILTKFNQIEGRWPLPEKTLRQQLIIEFTEEIDNLETLLCRDLSKWKTL